MKYRAEIDGLRAIAVIPVILFHAGFAFFQGGYVGVDVFFVISGYLITTIIVTEMERGDFSLVRFYERRVRRILPAMFLVMLACLPFAWFWLLPLYLKDFAQSLAAVSVFASNFLFWNETGYWGGANDIKPLLHTWSLAVEEQFYILFPLLLMVTWRFRKQWIAGLLILITVVSLALAQWGAYNIPEATFFLLPMRAWELAIGALLAYGTIYGPKTLSHLTSHQVVNEAGGIVGLLMIGYAVFAFDERVPFPSLYALLPTVGTALVILFASPATFAGRLLGLKILVGVGLISYSAYLWHQPLLAFARHRSLVEPSDLLMAALVLLTFPLAYLSWRFVETPFRNREKIGRRGVFTFAFVTSIAFIALGVAGQLSDGFNGRVTSDGLTASAFYEKRKPNQGLDGPCDGDFNLSPECRTSDEPEILVWGDSFAMHLVHGIMASNPDAKIVQMTMSVCGPFFDIAPIIQKYPISWAKECLDFTQHVREWLQSNDSVKYAVVSSPFDQYLTAKSQILFRDGRVEVADFELATVALINTLRELEAMGIRPVVFARPPGNDNNVGYCLTKAAWLGVDLDQCNFRVTEMSQSTLVSYRFLDKIAKSYPVIRLDDFICDSEQCVTHFDLTFVYLDDSHLSHEGSAKLGQLNNFYGMIVGDVVTTATAQ